MIYYFFYLLGSVYFAVALIAATIGFVVAGTFLEAKTQSHLFAAQTVYFHPAFLTLLALYFVNILASALRRWPFTKRHIPFLTTHFGLLMVLAGAFGKGIWGVQGTMGISEGSGTHAAFENNSYELFIEKKEPYAQYHIPLNKSKAGKLNISCNVISPHSEEMLSPWFYKHFGMIYGFPPLPVQPWEPGKPLPHPVSEQGWDTLAAHTDQVQQLLQALYLQHTEALFIDNETDETIAAHPLIEAVSKPISVGNQIARLNLRFVFSEIDGLIEASLSTAYSPCSTRIVLHLNGRQALWNINKDANTAGTYPVRLELRRRPLIALIKDETGGSYLAAFGRGGQAYVENFQTDQIRSLVVYDKGYSGYALQAEIPFSEQDVFIDDRKEKLHKLLNQIPEERLPPPMNLFQEACRQSRQNFSLACSEFLNDWDRACSTTYPPERKLPESVAKVFDALLEKREEENCPTSGEIAQLFSNYFLAHDLSPATLLPKETISRSTVLETPYLPDFIYTPSEEKVEDNRPLLHVKLTDGKQEEELVLRYDPHGTGLKWPAMNGKYRVRFQPRFFDTPYHIRLRDARQTILPNSNRPSGYESDLLITDLRNRMETEASISMNNVYETWDGYRFYLANIHPGEETAVQKAQIVVNHDPVKYLLTYPGGMITALGIIMLFWFKKF